MKGRVLAPWQFRATRLFYILAIPPFFYALVLAMTTPANAYEFMPAATTGAALLVWFALYRYRDQVCKLLLRWCDSRVFVPATVTLWGVLLVYFSLALQVEFTWDYGGAMRTAYQWATQADAINVAAYVRYPNNALLVCVLYGACKVMLFFAPGAPVETFRVIGCLLSSFSIFSSGLLFLKAADLFQRKTGRVFLLIYMTCIPLWMYSTICYTDTLGLPLLGGACWCLAKTIKEGAQKSSVKWLVLHSVLMGVAFSMKVTLAITFIAALIFLILSSQKKKEIVVRIAIALVAFVITSSLLSWGTARAIGITPQLREKYEFPKTHWVMMSLNTQEKWYAGGYEQSDVDYTKSFENRAEREAAVKERLLDRIKNPQRSLAEHILFRKVQRTWANGSLAADDYTARGPIKRGPLHEVFLFDGVHWKPTRALMQLWWVLLLGASLLGMIFRYKEKKLSPTLVLHLTVYGFFLFYLIWETNSRYLVVLVPVLALSAADGISRFYSLGSPHGGK